MESLSQMGSQPTQRVVQFRAKPGTFLLAAIEEAVQVEEIRALSSPG